MKKIFLLIACLYILQSAHAQDEAIFSHYNINPVMINPAAAGFDETQSIFGSLRASWSGFPGAPKTYGVVYNGPIGNTFGLGAGLYAENAAQMTRLRGILNYAFRFSIKEDIKLAAGFSTEFQQMQLDNSVLGTDFFEAGDKIVEDAVNGLNVFDASLGIYGTYLENTFFGFSFANLVRSRLDDIAGTSTRSFFQFYTFYVGHKIEIEELNFTLEPSIMMRQIRDVPYQFDFNIKAGFLQDQLITGLSYRSLGEGALGILLGTKLSALEIYYTFDISFQEFQQYNAGSHEVTLAFRLPKKNPNEVRY
jgi:type IX secretion system PorP/SprF family membrane protein